MSRWKPNVRFDHAFAIVRVDGFQRNLDFETALDSTITVKKIVWDQETAESEVARLNRLNKDKEAVYFWTITRVEKQVPKPF